MKDYTWFKNACYGMMIHWGLYSMLAGEWQGERCAEYAEWIQSNRQISIKDYEKLAGVFNPIFFNAEEYAKLAVECGMKYIVVTTKHHDGFAMYHSKVDKYNIVDATPFDRDFVKEMRDACEKYNLKFGIYYSQDLDWHEPHGGGYLSDDIECQGTTWDNSWDFPNREEKDFNICFEKKILPQIEEVMTNYGEISLAWFDVPMTLTKEQSNAIYNKVKELQPDCLINSRLGNGKYDYVSLGDNEIPQNLDMSGNDIDYNAIEGIKPSPLGLYETAATLNDSWGFSYNDHNWKSSDEIVKIREHLNGLGINYLLNIGPDYLGRIPAKTLEILRASKSKIL